MAWFEEAKQIYQSNPDLTYDEVASRFGRSGKTLKNRIYEERRKSREGTTLKTQGTSSLSVEEVDDTYYIYGNDYSCSINKDDLRRLKILYCEQKMTINQVCRKMSMIRRDFMMIKNAFGITHDDIPYIDEDLDRDIDELVEESIQRKKREYFIKFREEEIDDAFRELKKYKRKDYFHDKILNGLKQEIKEAPKISYLPTSKGTSEKKTLILNLSDLHKGKLILGSNMPSGNHYDEDVFNQRLNKVISKTEDMLKNGNYDKFYIINFGDSLDDPDANVYNKQILHQYASGESQVIGYLQAMELLLSTLAQYVKIHYVGVPGNHSKNIVNWDVLANQLLEFIFRNHDTITFDCTDKASKVINIYDSHIVVAHGNHISNNSTRGQLDTLNIFRLYGLNSNKTYLFQGHLHHYESTKYRRVLLPSMCGGDDLAENMMNITSRPAQLLCVFTEEGLSEEHYVYLD